MNRTFLIGIVALNKPKHSCKRNGYKTRARAISVKNAKRELNRYDRRQAKAEISY